MRISAITFGVFTALIQPGLATGDVVDCAHCGAKDARKIPPPQGCPLTTGCGQLLKGAQQCNVECVKAYYECTRMICLGITVKNNQFVIENCSHENMHKMFPPRESSSEATSSTYHDFFH
ncbi:hypothetical protein PGT21_018689 [Puccinia graminis f. sp. tritici]|uniref:Extracellular membrane protein CFEM domain-containing protein n=1 Tax=Puccinia graminis f. sp. tritici TaxID=56615 RepID=A0A5B0NZ89_PUCGR|nr:hypothetical protein PGT21_018689 [Puccinia graminis f. sp. tritici]KAA1093400.1 hypothetical protein PGTUg99_008112 [Puccinia graminis f. sp. tritici]